MARAEVVSVFAAEPGGGNPAPIVLDADDLTDDEMQAVAREHGLESSFGLAAPAGSGCDLALRFWVPNHEMTMCGHATVGTVWLLDELGRLPGESLTIWTASGPVTALVHDAGTPARRVEISQPAGRVEDVAPFRADEVLAVLGISPDQCASAPIQNATTSRTKTLVPVLDEVTLDGLEPDFARIDALCEQLGSTGLYPYAVTGERTVAARQFPRASGYPEDAATGIAAAALAYGLRHAGRLDESLAPLTVRQGYAMGRPSQISVRFDPAGHCWLGGSVSR
jgi:PhzF family phenazine biosynthesis protein